MPTHELFTHGSEATVQLNPFVAFHSFIIVASASSVTTHINSLSDSNFSFNAVAMAMAKQNRVRSYYCTWSGYIIIILRNETKQTDDNMRLITTSVVDQNQEAVELRSYLLSVAFKAAFDRLNVAISTSTEARSHHGRRCSAIIGANSTLTTEIVDSTRPRSSTVLSNL